ncbi:MAG: BMP family protein [Drouetiella hepatica Uher 2000/2452]|jgi:basic membrane protein A|uniref:BMP family protein n=1 Tax=Drouetiella hepatica Uher 2000/2452 TaxID=904376 RepID=A0A951QFZ2_9CYAN|nr:BMP family protein [Drouetiella hepatica Uher 2000/2452]
MTAKHSRRTFIAYGSAALGTSLLLKACANQSATPNAAGDSKPFKVAAVFVGLVTDKGWNQSAFEGLNAAKKKLGFEFAYVERTAAPDQAEALSEFARQGYNVVLGHSGEFVGPTQQVAGQFPNTLFLVTNGGISGSNIASVQTNNLQAGYLSGTMGALMTQSNKIAFVVAKQFKAMDQILRGFELGAKAANPAVVTTASYTGDWDDVAKAKEATTALISSGVDVIYSYLDNGYVGVLEAVKEQGVYLLGNTSDRLSDAPKTVLTSVVQNVGTAIASVVELAQKGEVKNQVYVVGAENPEVLYLGRFSEAVPLPMKQKVTEVEKQFKEGALAFKDCSVDGKESWCLQGATST